MTKVGSQVPRNEKPSDVQRKKDATQHRFLIVATKRQQLIDKSATVPS